MQRKMDLVRTILLKMESDPSGGAPRDLGIMGFRTEEIGYHAHIMAQDGLIEGFDITSRHSTGPECLPTKLTWKGHEFLDLARDMDRWNRAKSTIAKVGSAPISIWTKVLSDLLWKSVETAGAKPN
jgi:hypothetical protein